METEYRLYQHTWNHEKDAKIISKIIKLNKKTGRQLVRTYEEEVMIPTVFGVIISILTLIFAEKEDKKDA